SSVGGTRGHSEHASVRVLHHGGSSLPRHRTSCAAAAAAAAAAAESSGSTQHHQQHPHAHSTVSHVCWDMPEACAVSGVCAHHSLWCSAAAHGERGGGRCVAR